MITRTLPMFIIGIGTSAEVTRGVAGSGAAAIAQGVTLVKSGRVHVADVKRNDQVIAYACPDALGTFRTPQIDRHPGRAARSQSSG